MSWCFAAAPRELPALSLAAAVAVARALEAAGATGIGLKWPNDVLHAGGKLAGVLVDVDGDARGPLRAVVGIGLNLAVSERLGGRIAADGGLPAAALECALPGGVQRNALAAGLLTSLYGVFHEFSLAGFAPFAAEWERRDCLRGQEVCVREAAGERRGIARGVAADGALLLQQPGGMAAVVNGEVSLRAGP
jgi:BirA family biotin operon repressor/biotin-[acetyl-CoA-carboxylase] ligase